jgi:isoleucyl-tRNA synthetase
MAPFTPYISDYLNLKLFNEKKSIHLQSWPKTNEKLIMEEIEKNKVVVKQLIQSILSEREKAQIGVRWPLSKVTIQLKEEIEEFSDLIKKQTNIKEIEFKKGELKTEIDTKLTPKLEAEGFSREITRRVQALRKKAKLQKEDNIDLEILDKNNLLSNFKKEIKDKTGATTISISDKITKKHEFSSKDKIKDKEFEIHLTKK